eukprot:COSAG02_NODE_4057_length_5845_cov_8.300557_2_plen_275_part_00
MRALAARCTVTRMRSCTRCHLPPAQAAASTAAAARSTSSASSSAWRRRTSARSLMMRGWAAGCGRPPPRSVTGCVTQGGSPPLLPRIVGSSVLELGAGTGIGGMVAAVVGAADVVTTDMESPDGTLNLIRHNIEANRADILAAAESAAPAADTPQWLRGAALDWTAAPSQSWRAEFEPAGGFDYILAAECIYTGIDTSAEPRPHRERDRVTRRDRETLWHLSQLCLTPPTDRQPRQSSRSHSGGANIATRSSASEAKSSSARRSGTWCRHCVRA